MPMSDTQQKKLMDWINKKVPNKACRLCGQNNWQTGLMISAPEFSGGSLVVGGPNIPAVQLICTNCAHIELFAAGAVGLVK